MRFFILMFVYALIVVIYGHGERFGNSSSETLYKFVCTTLHFNAHLQLIIVNYFTVNWCLLKKVTVSLVILAWLWWYIGVWKVNVSLYFWSPHLYKLKVHHRILLFSTFICYAFFIQHICMMCILMLYSEIWLCYRLYWNNCDAEGYGYTRNTPYTVHWNKLNICNLEVDLKNIKRPKKKKKITANYSHF